MSEDKIEKWAEFYRFASIELENAKMAGRIGDARGPIVEHIEKLKGMPGLEEDEIQAIDDALDCLKETPESEDKGPKAGGPSVARAALEKLRVIAPKLRNPKV